MENEFYIEGLYALEVIDAVCGVLTMINFVFIPFTRRAVKKWYDYNIGNSIDMYLY